MKELQLIQSALKAPKGQTNAFGKYKYRSCEDILEALKPLLAEHGCVLVVSDDIVQKGDRYYIKATAEIYRAGYMTDNGSNNGQMAGVMGDEDNIIECYAKAHGFAREPASKKGMDESQITGAASSYARKYALNGLFAIDDTKDADATNDHKAPKLPKRAEMNKELGNLTSLEEFKSYARNFAERYGSGVWVLASGHSTKKSETVQQLFETHKNRLSGVPPVDTKGPEDMVKEFMSMVNTCDDAETYKVISDMYDNNPALQINSCTDAFILLQNELTQSGVI